MHYHEAFAWFAELKTCTACTCRPEAKQVVPGHGSTDAGIMLLGRNPGKDEDKLGVPFVGRAGQELDIWLEKLGLDRTKLVITNVVKCHTEKDRPPRPAEIAMCAGRWLFKELTELPELRAILPLGVEATKFLLGDHAVSPAKLTAYAERIVIERRELHVMPLAHPSYFLRSPGKKVQLYTSVLPRVREYLRRELPAVYDRSIKVAAPV